MDCICVIATRKQLTNQIASSRHKSAYDLTSSKFYNFTSIMHHHSQLDDLVDVLAVNFDIVDRLRDSRKRNGPNDRKAIETLEPLASA